MVKCRGDIVKDRNPKNVSSSKGDRKGVTRGFHFKGGKEGRRQEKKAQAIDPRTPHREELKGKRDFQLEKGGKSTYCRGNSKKLQPG